MQYKTDAGHNEKMSKVIEVSRLSISLGGKTILRDVSLGAESGDLLCVVGRNGAGKSTLFRCICGVHKKFTGSIKLTGRTLHTLDARARARIVAYVPQNAPPDIPYTVREFMEMSRYPWEGVHSTRGGPRGGVNAVSEAISLAGLSKFADRGMRDLSGGERQRVMIAAAIAQEPDAILMDEPTTFLDYAHQIETMELITRVKKERNIAMLVVTHDVNLAMKVSDRVLALSEGRVEWTGAPHELRDDRLLRSIFGVSFEQYFPAQDGARQGYASLLAPIGL